MLNGEALDSEVLRAGGRRTEAGRRLRTPAGFARPNGAGSEAPNEVAQTQLMSEYS
jgi:hypothetical protein